MWRERKLRDRKLNAVGEKEVFEESEGNGKVKYKEFIGGRRGEKISQKVFEERRKTFNC